MKIKLFLFILLPILWFACTSAPPEQEKIPLPVRAATLNETVYRPAQFFKHGEVRLGDVAELRSLNDHIGIAEMPRQTFDAIILAEGVTARNLFPKMRVQHGDMIVADTTVDAAIADYVFRNLSGTGDSLFVILSFDYWNPEAGEDVNLIIHSITIRVAQAGQINLFSDSIKVSWEKNKEIDLAGYFTHLGNVSGSYRFKSAAITDTTYKFTRLPRDTTYFLAATAFDTAGNESGYSNELRVRLFSRNETNRCDCDGDGEVTPSDFTLFDWLFGYTRVYFLEKFAGADSIAILAAFDRADFDRDGIVSPSDAQNFDLSCLSKQK